MKKNYTLKLIKNYPRKELFQFFLANSRHFLQIFGIFEGSKGISDLQNLLGELRTDPIQGAKFVQGGRIDMDRQIHFF